MRPKRFVVPLGVADVARACAFSETLRWPFDTRQSNGNIAFFLHDGVALAQGNEDALAADANLHTSAQTTGFCGASLAQRNRTRNTREAISTVAIGRRHRWKLAHNPFAN